MNFRNGIVRLREKEGGGSFSAVITGDCCPWASGTEMIQSGKLDEMAGSVKEFIADADLRIVQFETPLTVADTPIDKYGPNLRCPPDVLDLLVFLDLNIALLANNHTGDYGGDATMETIEHLENSGIRTVGAGANIVEAAKPLRVENDGISVNILNFAEHEFGIATATTPGCAPLDPIKNIEAIREAKATSDLVIVTIHGGHEKNPLPSPRMTKTYRAFADAGADVVFNCHSHCPEPIEVWNGTPIIYSPGNFFFPASGISTGASPLWWRGYLPKLYFDKNGVHSIEVMPFGFDNNHIFRLSENSEKGFFEYMNKLNQLLANDETVLAYFEAWTAHLGSS